MWGVLSTPWEEIMDFNKKISWLLRHEASQQCSTSIKISKKTMNEFVQVQNTVLAEEFIRWAN